MIKKMTLSLENLHSLCVGSLYHFHELNMAKNHATSAAIIERKGCVLRFEGVRFNLWTFSEILGGWTVSLAPNQLIGKKISEVIL